MRLKTSLLLTSTILLSCFVFFGITSADDEVIVLSQAIREALPDVFGEAGFAAVASFGVPIVGEPTIPASVSELSGDVSLAPYGGAVIPPTGGGGPVLPVPVTPQGPVIIPGPSGPHITGTPVAVPNPSENAPAPGGPQQRVPNFVPTSDSGPKAREPNTTKVK